MNTPLQLTLTSFKAGSYIFLESRPANDFFFIIKSGMVKTYQENNAIETVTKLGPGDFIGVVPCMSGRNQLEMVVAATDVTCLCIKRSQYSDFIAKYNTVALKIIRVFAKQMRELNFNLTQITLKNTALDRPEELFNIGMYYFNAGDLDAAYFALYQYLKYCPNSVDVASAKKKCDMLKKRSAAVYLEPSEDMNRTYPKGAMIMAEHQPGNEMYIIQSGQVRITRVVDEHEMTLTILGKGDLFGEMSLLEDKPRSANAIAASDCRLMAVNRNNFNMMVSSQPQLVSRLTTTFAERVWSMYRQLANARIFNPLQKMLDMLSLKVEQALGNNVDDDSYKTNYTVEDIVNLCGIPQEERATVFSQFRTDKRIKIVEEGKIMVVNCDELLKIAETYRKNSHV
ncbi:MAG: cyclic nucleotide-binding domain-containing protein [Treponema sp.]|nr:cyclic nucleotide-binding domain-containing protein [Treponema sp.]